jgi:outer membrane protein assembly factor BamB
MNTRAMIRFFLPVTMMLSSALVPEAAARPMPLAREAEAIRKTAGFGGGLIVHLGCGDGVLTGLLAGDGRALVHGLTTDRENLAALRETVLAKSFNGNASVDVFDGRTLPYVDGLVNLVVAENLGEVPLEEVMRVLAPEGVLCTKFERGWRTTVKPRPDDIDEWSHFLHDAGGNAVAQDKRVGPPKQLRWEAGPRWCRSHEIPSSVSAIVSSGGRIFTIFDHGVTGTFKKLPRDFHLVARDASNGMLLWRKPLKEDWQPEFGTGTGGRWEIHHTIPRRLIASGDRVYVTLGFLNSPVTVLLAGTGTVVCEAIEGTEGTDEMILSDGVLVAKLTKERSAGAMQKMTLSKADDTLVAIDVETRKQLWRKENVRVLPYAFAAADGKLVYHDQEQVVCLDLRKGGELWRASNLIKTTVAGTHNLIVKDGVVLFHGLGTEVEAPKARQPAKKGKKARQPAAGRYLTAYDLKDGKQLWQNKGKSGWAAACTQPTDVFVIDGLVWSGGSMQGVDLRTGEPKKELSVGKLVSPGHHYRCHRSKATENYLIWPKRGAEFADVKGDDHMRHDFLRGPCFTGLTPANGLLYVPPNQCFCYPGVKLSGFLALAAGAPAELKPSGPGRLVKGPAFGAETSGEAKPADWPMYRRNAMRCGSTAAKVPVKLAPVWTTKLAVRGTQPVVVGDRLWVAEKDANRLRCIDSASGEDAWSFIAGGRIDSAPTVTGGLVFFGCRDGWVYCLRVDDGELVWRFRAAPEDRRVVSYQRLESLWPVHGSVVVQDGVVYFAAGRSSFLDGGILVYGLDANTGALRHHHKLEGPWPDIEKDAGTPFAMEGALPDLLVSDGKKGLYMQRIKFDAQLKRLETVQESPLGELDMGEDHLVATGGFLDDTGFDRVYWMHGKRWPGFYFAQYAPKAGQLVVFDDATAYAVKYFYQRLRWSPAFTPGEHGYLLFADDLDNQPALDEKNKKVGIEWLPEEVAGGGGRRGGRGAEKGTGYVRAEPAKWQQMVPLRIRAMVLAGDVLFAAGLPDVLDEGDPVGAFEGRKGTFLCAYDAESGKELSKMELPGPVAFDGMSAVEGKLFVALEDGRVVCLSGGGKR